MLPVMGVLAVLAAAALIVYLKYERLGRVGVGFAMLRTLGLAALLILFMNPGRSVVVTGGPPVVMLDASLSMGVTGGQWSAALDTARALAGERGTILRFGRLTAPFDSAPPIDGLSRVHDAIAAARALGGMISIVTDGEITDALEPLPARLVVLSRDTVPSAALIDVALPQAVQRTDTLMLEVTIATVGAFASTEAVIEVHDGPRRLVRRPVVLPVSPGVGRRRVALDASMLPLGDRALSITVMAPGDAEPRDNRRVRFVSVTDLPSIVVIADPGDWESRFLYETLRGIVRTSVRGFARIGERQWVDMRSAGAVDEDIVRRAVRAAALVVDRAGEPTLPPPARTPRWQWLGEGTAGEVFTGDWYVTDDGNASPVLGALAGIAWDSLPPLTGLVPLASRAGEWTALSARRGRRGAARAVLLGSDSAGTRRLITAGSGWWRWAFRGGSSREAYRALLAAGIDWLLESGDVRAGPVLMSEGVSQQGTPARFRWRGAARPDSVRVTFQSEGARFERTLRFDPDGVALVDLEPDVYRWSATGVGEGLVAVEEYSDEFPPRPIAVTAASEAGTGFLSERLVRQSWWLFAVAIVAFGSEWAWRLRRGLP